MSTKIKSVFALIVMLNVWMTGVSFAEKIGNSSDARIERQEKRTELKYEELPDAIKTTLNEKYKGATLIKAFEISKDGVKEYEVQLSVNNEAKTVKFDKDGNVKQ